MTSEPGLRNPNKTFVAKPAEAHASRRWWVVDAKGQSLGRLASRVATILRGKHKPTFTPHVDTGDYVIVINASAVKLTGSKPTAKNYYRHTSYPGGIRETPFFQLVAKHPERPIQQAVKGMLPKNTLGRQMISKLKIYGGEQHPHQAQQPETLSL